MSVGFYFGDAVEEQFFEEVEVRSQGSKGFEAQQLLIIVLIIMGIGLLICVLVVVYLCCRKQDEIIIDNGTEVSKQEPGAIRISTLGDHPSDHRGSQRSMQSLGNNLQPFGRRNRSPQFMEDPSINF